jgi:hypothetical protein
MSLVEDFEHISFHKMCQAVDPSIAKSTTTPTMSYGWPAPPGKTTIFGPEGELQEFFPDRQNF